MELSEKIRAIGIILGIIAMLTLFQSSSLNSLALLMAIILFFRYLKYHKDNTLTRDAKTDDTVIVETNTSNSGIIGTVVDNLCSLVVTVALISLPAMLLYLISPYQTVNFIVGSTLGIDQA
jgi:hypothetical protein